MFNPSKLQKLLVVAAHMLVIGALAATVARAIWFVALGPEAAQSVEATPTEAASTPDVMDVEQIAALDLFGTPPAAGGGFDVDAAPDTELDLKLLGIFLANQPAASVAIIGSRGDAGEAYGVGDQIFGNAKLQEIHRDVVLINRAGKMEALRFDDELPLAANPTPRAARNQSIDQGVHADAEPLAALDAGDSAPEALEASIEAFRDRLERDPDGTLRSVGLEPVSVGGDDGYRIGQRAASRQLGRSGLQPGDTIVSIDGRPIGEVRQSPEAFGDLLSKGSARLEIRRGDRRFFLTTSLATLVALAATNPGSA